VDPVPDPLFLRKISGSAGIQTRTSGYVARNSDNFTTEAVAVKYTRNLATKYMKLSVCRNEQLLSQAGNSQNVMEHKGPLWSSQVCAIEPD
jgi:hypothetical protein